MNLSLNSMSERERRMVYVCGVVAVLVLIFVVIVPLDRSVAATKHRVEQKTTDLAWMRSVAPQLAAVGTGAVVAAARESSLASSMVGSSPSGTGALRVRFEKAPFDTLVAWLARLSEQQGIRVDSAQIDDAGKPGLVNAAVVLSTR
jgi:general secretion pathway protein M